VPQTMNPTLTMIEAIAGGSDFAPAGGCLIDAA
jgi:hypothetical protein